MERVVDNGDPRRFRTEIPNIVDDMDLDPYSFRLYVHLKRVAGDSGQCWQSTKTLAKACRMSAGEVSKAKRVLLSQGLIQVIEKPNLRGGKAFHEIHIMDVWPKNLATFASSPSEGDRETSSPNEVTSSRGELASSHGEGASSRGEIKNKPLKNKPMKKEPMKKTTAAPKPPLPEPIREAMRLFGRQSLHPPALREKHEELLRDFGDSVYLSAINWACTKMGMGEVERIRSACKRFAENNGQQKPKEGSSAANQRSPGRSGPPRALTPDEFNRLYPGRASVPDVPGSGLAGDAGPSPGAS